MFATSSSTANIIPFPPRGSFSQQDDLFLGAASTPTSTGIVGLAVEMLHRPCRDCGSVHFIIGSSVAMHEASVRCAECDRHGGWLSKGARTFIEMTVAKFGRPTTAIIVRERKKDF
jgi:hypothetical protein